MWALKPISSHRRRRRPGGPAGRSRPPAIDNLQVISHYVTPSADRLWRLAASHRVRVRLRLALSGWLGLWQLFSLQASGSNELSIELSGLNLNWGKLKPSTEFRVLFLSFPVKFPLQIFRLASLRRLRYHDKVPVRALRQLSCLSLSMPY